MYISVIIPTPHKMHSFLNTSSQKSHYRRPATGRKGLLTRKDTYMSKGLTGEALECKLSITIKPGAHGGHAAEHG